MQRPSSFISLIPSRQTQKVKVVSGIVSVGQSFCCKVANVIAIVDINKIKYFSILKSVAERSAC